MARMIFSHGEATTDLTSIQAKLAEIGITLRQWPVPQDARAQQLLEQAVLDEAQKEELLRCVDHRFETLRQESGYTTRDIVVLHEAIPGIDEMLAKFDKVHYHTDDEVRYILAGKGYFGFVDKQGEQFMLEVAASDYINVPADTEHWFTLGDSKRIKAVRYFIDTSGWTPVYTQRTVASFE